MSAHAWDWLDTKATFRHPNVVPADRGWYVRDWRGVRHVDAEHRTLAVDLWEPVSDRADSLFPGQWYVLPGINDATAAALPWRPMTQQERYVFEVLHRSAVAEVAKERV